MENEHKKEEKKRDHTDEMHAAEEQGILPEETSEEIREDMDSGDKVEDPDTVEGREVLVDEDAMEPWEAGFTQGASEEGQHAKDALTGEPLMDVEDVVEAEINGRIYRFVNEENARKFREKHEK